MTNRNLYTFGCSYTENKYPTYADYLAPYFDNHYNYGFSGSGNRSIFAKLGKLLAENKITENDTVIIQWSSIPREDRIFGEKWVAGGIINNSHLYELDWVEKYFDYTQQTIELIAYIKTIIPAIRNITKELKWFYMLEPWVEHTLGEPGFDARVFPEKYSHITESNLISTLKSLSDDKDFLGSIEGFYIDSNEFSPKDRETYVCYDDFIVGLDDHPPQIIHYAFSKKILQSLGYEKFYFEENLNKNAIEWTNYIKNPDRIKKVEQSFYKKYNIPINYLWKPHLDSPTWPSTNTKKNLRDV